MYYFFHQFTQILNNKDKLKIAIVLMLIFFSGCLEVLGIGIILPYLAILLEPQKVLSIHEINIVYIWLKNIGIVSEVRHFLMLSTFLIIVFYWLKNIFFSLSLRYQINFNYDFYRRLSSDLLRYYVNENYIQHINRNTSDIIRNINQQTMDIIQGFLFPFLMLVSEILIVILLLVFLISINPLASLYVFILLGLCIAAIFIYSRKELQRAGESVASSSSAANKAVLQSLGSFKTTKMLGKESYFVDSFDKAISNMSIARKYLELTQSLPRFLLETAIVTVMMSLAIIVLYQGKPSQELILLLSVFGLAGVRLLPSMNRILNSLNSIKYSQGILNTVISDMLAASNNSFLFVQPIANNSDRDSKFAFLDISLMSVSFKYTESQQTLDNISLTVSKNQSVGFVGHSGSGKSTLIDVMLGLLVPDSGTIKINGAPIESLLSSWQKNIGYIPQDIYLIDDTIKSNIAFGIDEQNIDMKKIADVIKTAQLDELINSLPKGIETVIGERGVKLSGGQRQRIGIARALYHEPQVLVMDEATAALDNMTEKAFMKAIKVLKGKTTLIMIAHRLTTIQDCDVIYFMEDGKIIDSGSYKSLIRRNSQFHKLANITNSI